MRELNFATEPSLRQGLRDVYPQFQEELESQTEEAVRVMLQQTLEFEADEQLQAHRHERSEERIDYAGIGIPNVVIALSREGVERRELLLARLNKETLVLLAPGVDLPPSAADVFPLDFKSHGIKPHDWALAALATLAKKNRIISIDMLRTALTTRFRGDILTSILKLLNQITAE